MSSVATQTWSCFFNTSPTPPVRRGRMPRLSVGRAVQDQPLPRRDGLVQQAWPGLEALPGPASTKRRLSTGRQSPGRETAVGGP